MGRGKWAASAAAVFAAVCLAAAPVAAEGAAKLPDFTDDFESYAVSGEFLEEDAAIRAKWENNVLKGGEAQLMDSHLAGIGKVAYESGGAGNKVLHLNNAAVPQNTFFYMGPAGDTRVKDFTAGFRVKYLTENVSERSWIGISMRKKANVHYTGTNNLMFTMQRYRDSATVTGHAYAIFNGGDTSDLSDASTQALFGDALSLTRASCDVAGAKADEDTPWIDYKLVVTGSVYRLYANDVLLVDCAFQVNSFDYFGYLSLNCCTANVLVDDFYVQVADTSLPPAIEPLPAPVLTLDSATRTVSWSAVDGANLYAVYVNGVLEKTVSQRSYQLGEGLAAGEYRVSVVALSVDTFEAKDSAMSEAVIYSAAEAKKKGCGGASSAAAPIGIALAAFVFVKHGVKHG